MKILQIKPIRFEANGKGLVDVTYEVKCGFRWLKRKTITRRAFSRTGILWRWLDKPCSSLIEVTDIINGIIPELLAGETVKISDGCEQDQSQTAPTDQDDIYVIVSGNNGDEKGAIILEQYINESDLETATKKAESLSEHGGCIICKLEPVQLRFTDRSWDQKITFKPLSEGKS